METCIKGLSRKVRLTFTRLQDKSGLRHRSSVSIRLHKAP